MKKLIIVIGLAFLSVACSSNTVYRFGDAPVQALTPMFSSPENYRWRKGDTDCLVMPNRDRTFFFYSCNSGSGLATRNQMFVSEKEVDLNKVVILEGE